MRIFSNISPTIKISRKLLLQVVQCERYSNNKIPPNSALQRCYSDDNAAHNKDLRSSQQDKSYSSLLPIALIDLNPSIKNSTKLLLIPLNWQDTDAPAMRNTLYSIFAKGKHLRQIEAFTESLRGVSMLQKVSEQTTERKYNDEKTNIDNTSPQKIINSDVEESSENSRIQKQDNSILECYNGSKAENCFGVTTSSQSSLADNTNSSLIALTENNIDYLDRLAINVEKALQQYCLQSMEMSIVDNIFGLTMQNFNIYSPTIPIDNEELSNLFPHITNKGDPLCVSTIMKLESSNLSLNEMSSNQNNPFPEIQATSLTNITFPTNFNRKSYSTRKLQSLSEGNDKTMLSTRSKDLANPSRNASSSNESSKCNSNYNFSYLSNLLGAEEHLMRCDAYGKALKEAAKRREELNKSLTQLEKTKDYKSHRPQVTNIKGCSAPSCMEVMDPASKTTYTCPPLVKHEIKKSPFQKVRDTNKSIVPEIKSSGDQLSSSSHLVCAKTGGDKSKTDSSGKRKDNMKNKNPCLDEHKDYKPKCNEDPCKSYSEPCGGKKPTKIPDQNDKHQKKPDKPKEEAGTDNKEKKIEDSYKKQKDDPSKIKKDDPCKKKEEKPSMEKKKEKDDNLKKQKEDPCKKEKKTEDPCKKKEDPCKKKVEDSCKKDKKTEDPSKKQKEDNCNKQKEDPCKKDKKTEDPSKKQKEDSCNKQKEDPCKKDKKTEDSPKNPEDPCKNKKSGPCVSSKKAEDRCRIQNSGQEKKEESFKAKEGPCKKKSSSYTKKCKKPKRKYKSKCKKSSSCGISKKWKSSCCSKKKASKSSCRVQKKETKPNCSNTKKYFSTLAWNATNTLDPINQRNFANLTLLPTLRSKNLYKLGLMHHFSSKGGVKKDQQDIDHGKCSQCKSLAAVIPAKRKPAFNPHPKDGIRKCFPTYDMDCTKFCKEARKTSCTQYAFLKDTDNHKRKGKPPGLTFTLV